jgi:hypothetical protein
LEQVATRLNGAHGAKYRALAEACLVKDVLLAMLNGIHIVKNSLI